MGFKDEIDIKTAEDIVKDQLDSEILPDEKEEVIDTAEDTKEETNEVIEDEKEEKPESEDNKDEAVEDEEVAEGESDDDEEKGDEEEPKKKKKFFLQPPIIVAACIVLGALLGYFIFVSFFQHSPVGIWELETEEGLTYYFEFKDDGTNIMSIGSIDNYGYYQVSTDENGKYIYIQQSTSVLYGSYNMEITGSKILGNQEMHLSTGDFTQTLKQVSSKPNVLTKPADFVPNEALLGDWVFELPGYNVKYTFTFNDDGTAVYNQMDTAVFNLTYTVDDEMIHLTLYTEKEEVIDYPYTCEGDVLSFMGTYFIRAGSDATPDEMIALN